MNHRGSPIACADTRLLFLHLANSETGINRTILFLFLADDDVASEARRLRATVFFGAVILCA